MNEENAESWSEEKIEEWEHDRWLKIQEMGKKEEEKGVNAEKPEKYEDETEVSPDEEKKEDKGGKEEATSTNSPLRLSDPPTL